MNGCLARIIRTAGFVATLGCIWPASPIAAQGTTADIVGIVVDSSGSVLPGASGDGDESGDACGQHRGHR